MNRIELNEGERMAINEFLAEHWAAFCRTAENFMDAGEIESLSDKLNGE